MNHEKDPEHVPAPELPDDFHLPERRTLLEATAIAAVVAGVVLVLFILPAEYGVDPTRFGEIIGIKDMGAPSGSAPSVHSVENAPFRNDTATITLRPQEGLEYKFFLEQGSGFVYSWNATGPLYFDFHGEPDGDTSGYFESYREDTRSDADGSFNAPFAGTHGWYWQNRGTEEVTVTLVTAGHYEVVGIR